MVGYLARVGISFSRDRMGNFVRCTGLRAIDQKPRIIDPGIAPSDFRPGGSQVGHDHGSGLGHCYHFHHASASFSIPESVANLLL
jgi:hypothetical protein